MRNAWRVLVFDILAPLAVLASLVYIGLALERPLWWVVVGTIVGLLVLQASVVNFVLFRRDGVTMGTDDDAPRLRLAVVGLTAVAVVAASAPVSFMPSTSSATRKLALPPAPASRLVRAPMSRKLDSS